jgi:beta-phosphoglucomutase
MAVKAIVFDFDGVLADSEWLHLRAYQELLQPIGVPLTKEIYCERYLGFDDEGVFQQVAKDYGLLLGDEEIELLILEKGRRFEKMISTTNVLYPAAVPTVRALAAAYPLGIASGSLRKEIDLMLRGAALDDAFKFIVSADDTERTKPAPDPYLKAAELHAVAPSECVAIEDSNWGLQSAHDAGMVTIGLASTYPPHELKHADVIVERLEDITPAFIKRF